MGALDDLLKSKAVTTTPITNPKVTAPAKISALDTLLSSKKVAQQPAPTTTKYISPFLGGGAYNSVPGKPNELVNTDHTTYGGLKTNIGQERDDIVPVSLGGSNQTPKNMRMENALDTSKSYSDKNQTATDPIEIQAAKDYKAGKISLPEARLRVLTAKQKQTDESNGINTNPYSLTNLWGGLKKTIKDILPAPIDLTDKGNKERQKQAENMAKIPSKVLEKTAGVAEDIYNKVTIKKGDNKGAQVFPVTKNEDVVKKQIEYQKEDVKKQQEERARKASLVANLAMAGLAPEMAAEPVIAAKAIAAFEAAHRGISAGVKIIKGQNPIKGETQTIADLLGVTRPDIKAGLDILQMVGEGMAAGKISGAFDVLRGKLNEGIKPVEIKKITDITKGKPSVINLNDPKISYEVGAPKEMVKDGNPILAKTEINKTTGETKIKISPTIKNNPVKLADVIDHEHSNIVKERLKPSENVAPEVKIKNEAESLIGEGAGIKEVAALKKAEPELVAEKAPTINALLEGKDPNIVTRETTHESLINEGVADMQKQLEVAKQNEPKIEPVVENKPIVEPQKPQGEILKPKTENIPETEKTPSKVAKSIEAKAIEKGLTEGFKDVAGYDKITIKDQAEKAANLMHDMNKARNVLRGDEPLPQGLKGEALIKALEDHAMNTGDHKLALEIAKSPLTAETSAHAQGLRLLAERNPDSISAKIKDVIKTRADKLKAKFKDHNPVKAKSEIRTKINESVERARPKLRHWQDLINEITC